MRANPNAMISLSKNTIFTNDRAYARGRCLVEGMTDEPPRRMSSTRQGKKWTPEIARKPVRKPPIPMPGFDRSGLAVPDD